MRAIIICLLLLSAGIAQAKLCPDPLTTSLQWGEPPKPWIENPMSPHSPQGESTTRFVRANILVAGLGRGVTCTYQNSLGEYSILWTVATRIPSARDYAWVRTLGGYACSESLALCAFNVAE